MSPNALFELEPLVTRALSSSQKTGDSRSTPVPKATGRDPMSCFVWGLFLGFLGPVFLLFILSVDRAWRRLTDDSERPQVVVVTAPTTPFAGPDEFGPDVVRPVPAGAVPRAGERRADTTVAGLARMPGLCPSLLDQQ